MYPANIDHLDLFSFNSALKELVRPPELEHPTIHRQNRAEKVVRSFSGERRTG